jgi:hypothetical protein
MNGINTSTGVYLFVGRHMRKNILLLLFTFLITSVSYSQGTGDWYIIKRNGVIELKIRTDSICSRDLTFEFEPKRAGEFKCVKSGNFKNDTIKLEKELLLISKSEKDTNLWKGTRVIESKKNIYQLVSWTATDALTKNIPELIQIHKDDKSLAFGIYYFDKHSVDSLRRLKDMSSMDKNEFIDFFTEYSSYQSKFQKAATDKQIGLAVHFYNAQLIAGILLKKGYNPFFKYENLNNFLMEYKDDKVIKKLMDNMTDK